MKTILVVDDEPEIIRISRAYLEQAGFRVVTATGGSSALATFRATSPDLVILDLNLPAPAGEPPVDGLDVARAIRQMAGSAGATPIIMLTARVDETDRIIGLELGADDYVTKPFSPRELVARARAVLRRSGARPPEPELLRVGPLTVDVNRFEVKVAGRAVELTPTEFELLRAMAAEPGRAFSREQLIGALGADYAGLERTVDSHIKNLRAKLERDPRQPELVLTVFGVGYKLNDNP
jgi:two-component system alkaline phosphatase synthesis response regulator PhoP